MNTTSIRRLLGLTLLLSLAATLPLAAGDHNGRSYSLHTLDYRVAETLVWEICEQNGGKGEKCRVQAANPGGINVFASQDVHSQIVQMLVERDRTTPASLLFEIVLVRLSDNGGAPGAKELAPHHKRALDAIREIFPGRMPEILDSGLIRTSDDGQTRLADPSGDVYQAHLAVRSIVGGAKGLEFTVELGIQHLDQLVLNSTVSLAEGETVVAGSSSAGGGTAVVVLLTSK